MHVWSVCLPQLCQPCEARRGAGRTICEIAARCETVSTAPSTLQVKVISNSTTLIADAANKEDISMRVKQIKKELSETDSVYDTEKLSERIAKLAGGVAVIKVVLATLLLFTLQSHVKLSCTRPVFICTSHGRVVCVPVTLCKSCCMALRCHHSSTSGGIVTLHGYSCYLPCAPCDTVYLPHCIHSFLVRLQTKHLRMGFGACDLP